MLEYYPECRLLLFLPHGFVDLHLNADKFAPLVSSRAPIF